MLNDRQIKTTCKYCGKEFSVLLRRLNNGYGKFCSKQCYDKSQLKRIKYTCLNCGTVGECRPSEKRKYCSLNCRNMHKRNRIIKTCLNCGKEFFTYPYRDAKGQGIFCGEVCQKEHAKQKYESARIKKICIVCGKEYTVKKYTHENCNAICCSIKCLSEYRVDKSKGKNNPNWRGGSSFEPYCEKFNRNFKERVREFWDRKCVICGKTESDNKQKLSVHHVSYNKSSCCDDSTPKFVVLCQSCHTKTNFNRNYWENMLSEIINTNSGKCFYTVKEYADVVSC